MRIYSYRLDPIPVFKSLSEDQTPIACKARDKTAAVEHGGEGDAGRETMQALDRLESEIAQAPADRASWGAPEYVTVASIRGHPDRLPVDEDVVEGIVPTVVMGPFRCGPDRAVSA